MRGLVEIGHWKYKGTCRKWKERCLRDIKKYSFPHRVVNAWNGLEEDVVNAISVHKFKTELDKLRSRDGL